MNQLRDNPYVGPRTFGRADTHLFFGREREARELHDLVITRRLVLFYAQSGAGKSSLINACLIPGLEEKGFEVLPVGRVSGMLPSETNVDNIFVYNLMLSLDQSGQQLSRFGDMMLADFLDDLTTDEKGDYYYDDGPIQEDRLNDGQSDEVRPRVLIIDQFEEILTTNVWAWAKREDFFQQLIQALNRDEYLTVVLALREEYIAPLEPYVHLVPSRMWDRSYMQRMNGRAAFEAVTGPMRAKRHFAEGVAEKLVNNLRQIRVPGREAEIYLGESVEPVQLQVVCYQLWENLRGQPSDWITEQDLQEIGDVDRALVQFYESAIAAVVQETQVSEIALRDWFQNQLITEAGTRDTIYRGRETSGGIATSVADSLVSRYLLRLDSRAGGMWYELVHDRFIYPILGANQAWIDRNPVIQAARAWETSGRDEDRLYRGKQLEDALAPLPDPLALGQPVAEFLVASQEAERVRRKDETIRQLAQEQSRAIRVHSKTTLEINN